MKTIFREHIRNAVEQFAALTNPFNAEKANGQLKFRANHF